ncbi:MULTISPECIES: DUF3012 domain-containing protein [unclassified Cellvibrio]|jgi:uncharacterized protein HemX|uniref:DUF3012 domain-containing protein n=1 Tax=unclassified Cellvibrio TaxID=2624793 RepID=UPI0002F6F03F|nr:MULTISPECIES: DUF3012 domain-containing protein [unclassified Cellvibrio]UUA73519.1 DUF3012 domain-containing protein [Cellvibrio sp. QJXJ]
MMSLFREQKFLVILLILSVLVLGLGLFMIQSTNKKSEQQTKQLVNEQEKTVAAMNLVAEIAQQELKAQQSNQQMVQTVGDIKPQESLDRVAALNGRIPEVGSDDWCEVMMVKDAKDWTEDEQSLFAKHCL